MWTKVMAQTFTNYKPHEIAPPKGIEKIEICSLTGQLATPKCFETSENKETGEKIQRKTTGFEICTAEQAPKEQCELHGDVQRSFTKAEPRSDGKVPRALEVKTETNNTPVAMKAPTVIGNDPYNSIQAVNNQIAIGNIAKGGQAPIDNNGVPEPGGAPAVEVRKAEPVRPLEQTTAVESTIKLEPPKPIEF
jgi:hypothetical protein